MRSELQRLVRRQFPDYEIETSYPIALLRYHLALVTKVWERSEVSIVGAFVLRAIAAGMETPEAITDLLGLTESDLAIVGARLLRSDLAMHSDPDIEGRRRLALTMEGKQFLETGNATFSPRVRTYHLLFDPLTHTAAPAEGEETVTPDQVRKEGVFTLPWRGDRPTLGDVTLEEVRQAARITEHEPDKVQVLSIVRAKNPYEQYITGVRVFILRHWDTKERRYAAFRGGVHLPDVSQALLDLERQGMQVVPADVQVHEQAVTDVWRALHGERASMARLVVKQDQEIGEVESALERAHIQRSATQNERERTALEERVRQLEEQLAHKQEEQTNLLKELEAAHAQVVRENEHRPLLEEALKTAKSEIIIVSPWMTPRAVDAKIIDLMRRAAVRNVRIRIAYGFGQRGPEAERNRANAAEVKKTLLRHVNSNLEITNVWAETHEKILICDDAFAVATSFNWLSYSGPSNTDHRRETGFRVTSGPAIAQLRKRALELFATELQPHAP